jgi:hypothetical protein
MSELLRIEREVRDPDGTIRTETIVVPVEPELADILFRKKHGTGLDFIVMPEDGIRIIKHSSG